MAFDLMALRNKLLSRVKFCTEIDHRCCSYRVSVVSCRHWCCNEHLYPPPPVLSNI